MIYTLIVDDYALLRAGLSRLLGQVPDIHVIGEAESCAQIIRQQPSGDCRPDVLVVNVHTQQSRVLDGLPVLSRKYPHCRVIVIVRTEQLLIPLGLLNADIAGFLSQHCAFPELCKAVRNVHAGFRYVSDDLARHMAQMHLALGKGSPFEGLTRREMQILLLLTQGKRVRDISGHLYLSPKTINAYRNRLMHKLGVRTEVELTHIALRHGMIVINAVH